LPYGWASPFSRLFRVLGGLLAAAFLGYLAFLFRLAFSDGYP